MPETTLPAPPHPDEYGVAASAEMTIVCTPPICTISRQIGGTAMSGASRPDLTLYGRLMPLCRVNCRIAAVISLDHCVRRVPIGIVTARSSQIYKVKLRAIARQGQCLRLSDLSAEARSIHLGHAKARV